MVAKMEKGGNSVDFQGFYRVTRSAGGGSRTHTLREEDWILSPARLPISPLRQSGTIIPYPWGDNKKTDYAENNIFFSKHKTTTLFDSLIKRKIKLVCKMIMNERGDTGCF